MRVALPSPPVTAAELEAEKAALRGYVNKYIARRRAVNLLHVLAAALKPLCNCLECVSSFRQLQNALSAFRVARS